MLRYCKASCKENNLITYQILLRSNTGSIERKVAVNLSTLCKCNMSCINKMYHKSKIKSYCTTRCCLQVDLIEHSFYPKTRIQFLCQKHEQELLYNLLGIIHNQQGI